MQFSNKTVVVTGGSKGIGAGCARVFHREGGRVVVLDTDEITGHILCDELGERTLFVKCDVSKENEVIDAMARAVSEFGGIDVLVNNAGIIQFFNVTATTEENWDRVMDINVKGAFFCAKHAIPHMQKGGAGVVVNISSVQAYVVQANVAAYATSKAAIIGLTRSIAVDYAPDIRCVALCPGGVDTPMNEEVFGLSGDPEAVRQETIDIHLVQRMATSGEIGELAAFVASDKGSFLTGQPIRIDGGVGCFIPGSKT